MEILEVIIEIIFGGLEIQEKPYLQSIIMFIVIALIIASIIYFTLYT